MLRPGGRSVAIDTLARSGIAALFGAPTTPPADDSGEVRSKIFKGQGFVAVRVLAERDGLRFIEAVKKNG